MWPLVPKAKIELQNQKDNIVDIGVNFTENTSLNNLAKIYFEVACDDTKWTKSRKDTYKLYFKDSLGKKAIKNIRKGMEKKGNSKQTENACSPRTIKRVLVQVLKPILQYAIDNKVLADIPRIEAPPQNRRKKIVSDAGEKLATLYKTILSLYKDEPFYRALFMFALYGRRWNEIRTLKWSDIDVSNDRKGIISTKKTIRKT